VQRISSSAEALKACAGIVRERDPDRYFSALFAPAEKRPFLFALYAFNGELAHVGETVREPMLGEIRLAWWRETLAGVRQGVPRPHHVARALAAMLAAVDLPADLFDAMIDARQFDLLDGTFADTARRDAYVDATSANLMRLASRILGGEDRFDDLAREAGAAYGLAGLLRNRATGRGRSFLAGGDTASADAREHLKLARRMKKPKRALAAFLPATLVPLYLRDPRKDVSIHRRQIALLGASLRGRI
jgi:phytoene/squalene synthetase